MKKKSIVVLVSCLSIVFLWKYTFASAKDTLRGSEGRPIFSIIYTSDMNTNSSIDSFRIGHDFYIRLLDNDNSKGILAKKVNTTVFNSNEFILDDYTGIRLKDSLKKIAFVIAGKNNKQSYLIIELANQYYIYSMNDEKINLPISTNFIQLSSSDIIPFLKKHIGEKINQIKNIDTLFSVNDLKYS